LRGRRVEVDVHAADGTHHTGSSGYRRLVLVLTARLTVDPERVEDFEALARELWESTHRLEPGCRRYEYVRLPERGVYLALMVFDDHDAFLVHQASDHHTRIAGGPMRDLISSFAIEFGQPVEGAFGAPRDATPTRLDVDPAKRDHYLARYPSPDFSGWDR